METVQLKEELQHNLMTYLDSIIVCEFHETYLDPNILDSVCDIVIETIDNSLKN